MPNNLPSWVENPTAPSVALDIAETLRRHHLEHLLADRIDLTREALGALSDQEFKELLEELAEDRELAAIAEASALEHTAQLQVAMNQSVEYQAVAASQSGLYAYHPAGYKSYRDLLRDTLDALEGPRTATERSYLEWLIDVFIPDQAARGRTLREVLWDEGVKSKTKLIIDQVRPEYRAHGIETPEDVGKPLPATLLARLDQMLDDAGNKTVTVNRFREKYVRGTHASPMPAITGFEYLQGDGSILVLICADPAQVRHVKGGLKAEWQMGHGKEDWLTALLPKTIRAAVRKLLKAE